MTLELIKESIPIFDSHFHIIDNQFPLIENNGYLPEPFTDKDYLSQTDNYNLVGGAVVSGSFQGFDQDYLVNALKNLGDGFVGVTQVPISITDEAIIHLDSKGVRAVRFNLQRGGSEDIAHLSNMAARVHELVGWHIELYVDSRHLVDMTSVLIGLPSVSIDHLGLSKRGFNTLCHLVENNIKVKATGFSRVDFDVSEAIKKLHSINPNALMFGTDLPSTRAPVPYSELDLIKVVQTIGEQAAKDVLSDNARKFYRLDQ